MADFSHCVRWEIDIGKFLGHIEIDGVAAREDVSGYSWHERRGGLELKWYHHSGG